MCRIATALGRPELSGAKIPVAKLRQCALGPFDERGLGIEPARPEDGRFGGGGTVSDSLALQHIKQTVRSASRVRSGEQGGGRHR